MNRRRLDDPGTITKQILKSIRSMGGINTHFIPEPEFLLLLDENHISRDVPRPILINGVRILPHALLVDGHYHVREY